MTMTTTDQATADAIQAIHDRSERQPIRGQTFDEGLQAHKDLAALKAGKDIRVSARSRDWRPLGGFNRPGPRRDVRELGLSCSCAEVGEIFATPADVGPEPLMSWDLTVVELVLLARLNEEHLRIAPDCWHVSDFLFLSDLAQELSWSKLTDGAAGEIFAPDPTMPAALADKALNEIRDRHHLFAVQVFERLENLELGELHTAEVIRLPDAFVASLVQADHLYRSAA